MGGDSGGRLGQAEQGEAHESLKSSVFEKDLFHSFSLRLSVPSFLFCWCLGGTDVSSKLTWPYISGAPARSPGLVLAASAVRQMSAARWWRQCGAPAPVAPVARTGRRWRPRLPPDHREPGWHSLQSGCTVGRKVCFLAFNISFLSTVPPFHKSYWKHPNFDLVSL